MYQFSKCLSGCLKCVAKSCEVCKLSEWTEWKNQSSKCSVVSKRFRNYFGKNCKKTTVEEETQTFEKNCTCILKNIQHKVKIKKNFWFMDLF